MKKVYLSILLIMIIILSFGCKSKLENYIDENPKVIEAAENYRIKNNIKSSVESSTIDEKVIAYEGKKENDYKIVAIFLNNETNNIYMNESSYLKSNKDKTIYIAEIRGKDKYYVGIFIDDEFLLKKADSVKIDFDKKLKNKPFAIQQSILSKAQIIEYESDNPRKIKKISILNSQGKEIYSWIINN